MTAETLQLYVLAEDRAVGNTCIISWLELGCETPIQLQPPLEADVSVPDEMVTVCDCVAPFNEAVNERLDGLKIPLPLPPLTERFAVMVAVSEELLGLETNTLPEYVPVGSEAATLVLTERLTPFPPFAVLPLASSQLLVLLTCILKELRVELDTWTNAVQLPHG